MFNSILLKVRNKVRCEKGNTINIAANVRIKECKINIKGNGNKLKIANGAILRGVYLEIEGNNCEISIGERCVIGVDSYLSARENETKLTLGKECMLSRYVRIMTSDGHDILTENKRINLAQDIFIGDHVWLADNSTILKGVSIGHNSIVAINSTVTKDIGSNKIAAGLPAKVIRSNIEWHEKLTY